MSVAYDSESFMVLAPITSFLVLGMLLWSARGRKKRLKILADEAMWPNVLSNFSGMKYKLKAIICVLIPAIHALILARVRAFDGPLKGIDAGRHLPAVLIALLVVEQLLGTRRRKSHGKEFYAGLRRNICGNDLP
jgi:Na+-transporting NADH:ubiquinone oxidoreductase subunit NqrD